MFFTCAWMLYFFPLPCSLDMWRIWVASTCQLFLQLIYYYKSLGSLPVKIFSNFWWWPSWMLPFHKAIPYMHCKLFVDHDISSWKKSNGCQESETAAVYLRLSRITSCFSLKMFLFVFDLNLQFYCCITLKVEEIIHIIYLGFILLFHASGSQEFCYTLVFLFLSKLSVRLLWMLVSSDAWPVKISVKR